MRRRRFIYLLILLILSTLFIHYTYSFDLPKLFPFNKKDALGEWEEKVFKNKVLYLVEPIKEGGYLLAKSTESCSGLFYKIKFHPRELPMISWQWKVLKFPEKETIDGTKKGWIEKDDYAGRVYVIFPSWIFTHTKSIEYIWDESLPEGTILSSPYFHNIKLIVAQSGREKIGKWIFEEHNIYEDYNKAFGTFPSDYVGAIALMTDTDNTLSTAETLYKDIKVGYKK